jgi:hypothetical protein
VSEVGPNLERGLGIGIVLGERQRLVQAVRVRLAIPECGVVRVRTIPGVRFLPTLLYAVEAG